MTALLELLSFHLALFFGSTILFIFQGVPYVANLGTNTAILVWLLSSGAVVVFVSYITKAYQIERWTSARTGVASSLCFIGHLAPIAALYMYQGMARAGTGSGLAFLPIIAWGAVFYGVGVLKAMIGLGESEQ